MRQSVTVEPSQGYYSLIQFCPDRARLESVNVGVVLFVPSTGYLNALTSRKSRRLQQVFGKGAIDPWWLKTVRESAVAGLLHEHRSGRFRSPADLEQYFATLGNDIQITAPRPTRVESPDESLARLFARLVEGEQAKEDASLPPVVQPIEDAFRRLSAKLASVQFGQRYEIPGYHHAVEAEYLYRNGTANLVRLLRIGNSPSRAVDQAIKLGAEGRVVSKRLQIEFLSARLIIVAAPLLKGTKSAQAEAEFPQLESDFPEAKWIQSDDIGKFAQQVEAEAH